MDGLGLILGAAAALAWLHQPHSPPLQPVTTSGRCAMTVVQARFAGGELPPGMEMLADGQAAGIATAPGTFRYQVEFRDGCTRWVEWREVRVEALPVLTVEPGEVVRDVVVGGPAVDAGVWTVAGSPPGYPYTVEVIDAPWLRVTPRDGRLPVAGMAFAADTVALRIDPKGLAPGDYSGRVRFFAWRSANAPEVTVRLHVRSVQSLLPSRPGEIAVQPVPVTPPAPSVIVPPPAPKRELPVLRPAPPPRRAPEPEHGSGHGNGRSGPARSRVLPFPKVDISKPLVPAKPPMPERTQPAAKPSAMPPAAATPGPEKFQPPPKPKGQPMPPNTASANKAH